MTTVRAKIVRGKRGQTIRLPQAVAFPDGVDEVEIIMTGMSRKIVPTGMRWDDYFENAPGLSDDFVRGDDPPPQECDFSGLFDSDDPKKSG